MSLEKLKYFHCASTIMMMTMMIHINNNTNNNINIDDDNNNNNNNNNNDINGEDHVCTYVLLMACNSN